MTGLSFLSVNYKPAYSLGYLDTVQRIYCLVILSRRCAALTEIWRQQILAKSHEQNPIQAVSRCFLCPTPLRFGDAQNEDVCVSAFNVISKGLSDKAVLTVFDVPM